MPDYVSIHDGRKAETDAPRKEPAIGAARSIKRKIGRHHKRKGKRA